ncbi:class I SAM-dependent methyltransferase [Nocardia terpenica]|uniref:Methyltransferase domain-containing protein n=1 Tax=Nocardia terpenica TaxID=455432 RepID=A0A291RYW8_9NOCA|nr:hypothetical protein [Nocardia terpenica]ATL72520.1 hypothetical protein CRH09_39815 [Nocardia terpenica]
MNYFAAFGAAVDAESADHAWQRLESRWWSQRPIHQFSHRQKIGNILPLLDGYTRIMDVTRGASVDGVLGVLAAGLGKQVTIISPSRNHIAALERFAEVNGVDAGRIEFVHSGNRRFEELPVEPAQVVTALHILEHAPHPRALLGFLREHTIDRCVVAFPSCLNPTAWVRMGGGTDPYVFGRGSLPSAARGLVRTVAARIQGRVSVTESVDEFGVDTVHRWFFPGVVLRELEWSGFHVERISPDSLAIPWSNRAIEFSRTAQRWLPEAVTGRLGFGSHVVLRPVPA